MTYKVAFRPGASADLYNLYDYIATHSGLDRAAEYLSRIENACQQLRDFPERGTKRDDVSLGLRTIGFERRVKIAFRVVLEEVEIIAILYAGRDLTPDLVER